MDNVIDLAQYRRNGKTRMLTAMLEDGFEQLDVYIYDWQRQQLFQLTRPLTRDHSND